MEPCWVMNASASIWRMPGNTLQRLWSTSVKTPRASREGASRFHSFLASGNQSGHLIFLWGNRLFVERTFAGYLQKFNAVGLRPAANWHTSLLFY